MGARKRLQPELRKQQIIEEAVHVFFEMGYEGASLRDLANRVGINKATVYHYFGSKEEILHHIVQKVGSGLLQGVRDAFRSGSPPLPTLEKMIRFQIEYMDQHLEEIKVLVEEKKSLNSTLRAHTQTLEAEVLHLYQQVLDRCREAGVLRSVHTTTAAFGILGQINWLYQWYKPQGPLSVHELSDQVVSLLMHGLVLLPS